MIARLMGECECELTTVWPLFVRTSSLQRHDPAHPHHSYEGITRLPRRSEDAPICHPYE